MTITARTFRIPLRGIAAADKKVPVAVVFEGSVQSDGRPTCVLDGERPFKNLVPDGNLFWLVCAGKIAQIGMLQVHLHTAHGKSPVVAERDGGDGPGHSDFRCRIDLLRQGIFTIRGKRVEAGSLGAVAHCHRNRPLSHGDCLRRTDLRIGSAAGVDGQGLHFVGSGTVNGNVGRKAVITGDAIRCVHIVARPVGHQRLLFVKCDAVFLVDSDQHADGLHRLVGVVCPSEGGDYVRAALARVQASDRIGIRPVGGIGLVASGALGDGNGLGGRGLAVPGPPGEGVAGAGWIVQREGGGFNVVGGEVAAGVRAAPEVVGDGVGDGRPVGGIGLVARGALCDGDGLGRRGLAVPCPAREGVAGAGRVVQREGGGVDGVGGGVARAVRQRSAR